ncbi:MAG: TonB-dependent receptor [Bacteroidota bacterium]|nr:TonB-dependent receptor [Bacteroidota bacterium]
MLRIGFLWVLICLFNFSFAQIENFEIKGRVLIDGKPIPNATIHLNKSLESIQSDTAGNFLIQNLNPGKYFILISKEGFKTQKYKVEIVDKNVDIEISMPELIIDFSEITISKLKDNDFGITRLRSVEGTAIYESKKTEVIVTQDIAVNTATNNSRQIYAKIPGLNIWENDPGGLQLAIGARGLNPNRTSNFNTRQNGYDISADALGYPESYYAPPVEAVEKIEIVRGAASLQYGPQFGGMINYVVKKAPKSKKLEITNRETVGSYGMFNTFSSVGGTVKKVSYYGFYQYKRGDGWRPNSQFQAHTAFGSISYKPTEKLGITLEYTHMNYLAKQPGGLKDEEFLKDPAFSKRNRNWFRVNWNLIALNFDFNFDEKTKLNIRTFSNISSREALGNQNIGTGSFEAINRPDDGKERSLISDNYQNIGSEIRLIHRYNLLKQSSTFLVGSRIYRGSTFSKQGNAPDGNGPTFNYVNPNNLEKSDYALPSTNVSAFVENIFVILPQLTVTPGIRFEYIETKADGYFNNLVRDGAGNIIAQTKQYENRTNGRQFVLLGIGTSFKPSENIEMYGNISQNYRPVTFSDIRVGIAGQRVDPNIKDEKGFNTDIGIRGNIKGVFNFDASVFYLNYTGRIGEIFLTDPLTFQDYRFRTNIADSRTFGIEMFAEIDVLKLFTVVDNKFGISVFGNYAYNNATYYNSAFQAVNGNTVEYVPAFTSKNGLTFKWNHIIATLQHTYTSSQYSDATNTIEGTTNAIAGLVPSYQVLDFSVKYNYRWLIAEGGVNNIMNTIYFTRRATSYPGPGILPADPRVFYLTLGIKI